MPASTAIARLAGLTALALVALAGGAWAQSPTETCVEVKTTREDAAAIRTLVETEIDRFPTHRSADADCGSYLRVEIIDLAGTTYVTGRINTQVPHREAVTEDLATAIERMLRVVLHNDPVRLRGPRSDNVLRRGLQGLKNGSTYVGAEAFQSLGVLDGALVSLPGIAAVVRREATDWHLAARLSFAHRLSDPPAGQLEMTARVGFGLQALSFSDPLADTALYWGVELGMDHQRFAGPAPNYGEGADEEFDQTGFAVGLRVGVEFFRTTTGRLDLFTQATVPIFWAHDEEGGVVDAYVPGLSFGAGLWF